MVEEAHLLHLLLYLACCTCPGGEVRHSRSVCSAPQDAAHTVPVQVSVCDEHHALRFAVLEDHGQGDPVMSVAMVTGLALLLLSRAYGIGTPDTCLED